jgi:potassium-dependent mechanosensitive channel
MFTPHKDLEFAVTRFPSRVFIVRFLAAILVCGAAAPAWCGDSGAAATVAPTQTDPAAILDSVKQSLKGVEIKLADENLTDADLVKLRAALDPLSGQIQGVIADATPKLAAVKARLDQLGKPPDLKANPNAAPEDPAIAKERDDQQKLFATQDDLIKRANLAQLQGDQLASQIAEQRRALFANSVFQSSSSILAPSLWMDVARDTPHILGAARSVATDFGGSVVQAFMQGSAALFSVLAVALLAVAAGVGLLARKFFPRRKSGPEPDEFQKAVAALWVALATMGIPVATLLALSALAQWFNFSADQYKPLSDALFRGVVRFAWAFGLGEAILAPRRPLWRPLNLSDRVARRLMSLLLVLAGLISLGDLFEGLDEVVGASLPVSVAAKGTFSLLVGIALIRGLYRIVDAPDDEEDAASGRPANLADEGPWWPAIRFAAWAAIIAVIGADLVGYVALSSFLVRQLAWTGFVAGLLFLLQKAISEGLELAFHPHSHLGRALLASLGLRRERLAQIAVLFSGVVTLTLFGVAALLILAPWGLQSHDMVGSVRSAFFGFKVGDVTISPWGLLVALALFVMGYTITHTIQNWLEKRYLPLTQIDEGLQASIRTSVGYIGVVLSLLFAVAFLGINLENLALVAGALSVGIGLGLQGVVNNFVSGLILLWERAIKVGDLVSVGDEQGHVRRINVRATEIETADRVMMIVPNGNLMTGVVKNFVRGDRIGRVKIPIQVLWGVDPEKVRETLLDVAKSHDEVVGIPAPTVFFSNIGPNSLDFDLVCFVENVERAGRVRSDLMFAIFSRLREEGVAITGGSSAVHVSLPRIEPMLELYLKGESDNKA